MGMYTELVLKCSISKDQPDTVKHICQYLFNGQELGEIELPEHPFFECHRWDMIGRGGSFYHHPEAVNSVPQYEYIDDMHIFSRSDLKNYEGEIEHFVNWITPYLDVDVGDCIGWSWYEEDLTPTLIIIK